MRFLRDALSSFGLRRSGGVIEEMIACWRFTTVLSRSASSICFLTLPMPGSIESTPDMPPIFFICSSWSDRSSRSKAPLRILASCVAPGAFTAVTMSASHAALAVPTVAPAAA